MFNKFFEHPSSVCLTYFQHWKFAMEMSGRLFIGSIQSTTHAFFPFLFITSISNLTSTLKKRLSETGCIKEDIYGDLEMQIIGNGSQI